MENNINTTPAPRREPIFSKVGFWLSLTTFVIWMLALVSVILGSIKGTESADRGSDFGSIIMLSFMVCLPLGICGLIFSVKGLSKAARNDLPKAFAVWGIALLAGCLVIPLLAAIIFTIFR